MMNWTRIWGLSRSNEATPGAFQRLWRGFLTGRLMLALAILFLLTTERLITGGVATKVLWLSGLYVSQAAITRWFFGNKEPARSTSLHWLFTVLVDIAVCSLFMLWHGGSGLSFLPLLGLPVLMAAALGNLTVLLLTMLSISASLTLLIVFPQSIGEAHPQQILQFILACMGYLVLGLLVQQLAVRLTGELQEGKRNRATALLQSQVNAVVISSLEDGVLVVNGHMVAQSANPAALDILGLPPHTNGPIALLDNPTWRPLVALAKYTMRRRAPQTADLTLLPPEGSPIGIHARSWITQTTESRKDAEESHCVVFLHDLRKVEAKVRTEKLASMGRMSAAVAHEIRNPLSAIMQANMLLAEELSDPAQQRLTTMVHQNAERLRRIAEDILNVARVQKQTEHDFDAESLPLDEWIQETYGDWHQQDVVKRQAYLQLTAPQAIVAFNKDHLRRIMINLLDNALRYMGPHPDSLQILTKQVANGQASVMVWSDGAPLEKTVEQHLFEPFFSSESRSSGLGLFLCRELCERHGATISYQRIERDTATRGHIAGNAFTVFFKRPAKASRDSSPGLNELVV